MKIEKGVNPNCSEAVFRFYTLEPEEMREIIQAIVSTVDFSGNVRVPEFDEPERYDRYGFEAVNHDGMVTVEKDRGSFVVNCGNNSLTDHPDWVDVVKSLHVYVEEAEFSKKLYDEYARDCTCGIKFFEGYSKLLKNPTRLQRGVLETTNEDSQGDEA